eukprot:jgi/Tetstr1/437222/TSEL_025952.t1
MRETQKAALSEAVLPRLWPFLTQRDPHHGDNARCARPHRGRRLDGDTERVSRRARRAAGHRRGAAGRPPDGRRAERRRAGLSPCHPAALKRAATRAARARGSKQETRMCGIIGIYRSSGDAAAEVYEGLLMLQHRGQDSAGIVAYNGEAFTEKKDNGLVKDVFNGEEIKEQLKGNIAMGHVRYPTAGSSSAQEAQPFFVNSPLGIYLIHNGNLTNTDELRDILNSSLSFFNRHLRTKSDSEVLLNILADEVEGAYSCICEVNGVGLMAFRDPHGIRPLVLGHREGLNGEDEWCVSSEDCAFGPIGFTRVRDVRPGEMVLVHADGRLESRQCVPGVLNPCIFEYIYLSRPDSILNDIPVYEFQLGLGTALSKRILERGWDLDMVVPVPDGSRPAAIQISAETGLPYREGLVKNRYVGRTFIMPDQRTRELSVRRKLNAMEAVFKDKNVLLVDDSIVRGTTMAQIVGMVRSAGAKKVYLASAAPPVRYANVYGVDMPSKKEFAANGLTEEEVNEKLGADGLIYQTVEDLVKVGRAMNPDIVEFDTSCFTGTYVTGTTPEYLQSLEDQGRGEGRRSGERASLVGAA